VLRVEITDRAKHEMCSLPREVRKKLSQAIDDLRINPRPPGAKKLVGRNGFRIRKGNYRILYTVNDQAEVLTIYRAGHRREIYRNL